MIFVCLHHCDKKKAIQNLSKFIQIIISLHGKSIAIINNFASQIEPTTSLHKLLLNLNSYGVDNLYLIYDSKLTI